MSVASFTRPRRLVGLGRLLFKEKISGSNPLGVTDKMTFKLESNQIDKYPDICPGCGKGIQPIYCYSYGVETWRSYEGFLQVVFRCPREDCRRLFIAKYLNGSRISDTLFLSSTFLLDFVEFADFPKSVSELSEMFGKIYNQAKVAEENGLKLIAGPGYRKALEFLVKDYLIKIDPSEKEEIKEKKLGEVIKLIKEKDIEQCASRAAWLGNDETHYTRKWKDQDLDDLKNLIMMVVNWIDLKERSAHYLQAMPSKPPKGTS